MSDLNDIDSSPWLALLAEASDGVVVAAPQPWRLIYANSTFASLLGSVPEELRGRRIDEIFGGDAARELVEHLVDVLDETVPSANLLPEQMSAVTSVGPMTIHLHRVQIGGQALVAMLVRDTAHEPRQPSAEDVGRRDSLTGLADRSVLLARMAALLRGGRAADLQFAVLFIDLDNFKQVNDAHGHLVGDRVLREVARRLAGCVRTGDHIVRFGGDEFVALVERVSGWQEIQPAVDRIHAAFAKPIALAEGEVTLSVSVGVAEASAEHRTPEDLLRDADRAMYASKRLQT